MYIPLTSLAILAVCSSIGHGLEIPPDTPLSSLIATAKTYLAEGSPREALQYFDAAVARDPNNYVTIFQRGAAYLSLGRNAQASNDFDRVLKLKPGFEGALSQRCRLRTLSADWAGAKSDLEKLGKASSAEYKELQEAQDAGHRAQDAEKQGEWETCVSQASVAILTASSALSLRQTRAHCHFERGEIEEGINDLGHILHLSPGSVDPHLQISSMLFYALGDTDRGIAQIRKCLHSDPDSKPCKRLHRQEKSHVKQLTKLRDLMSSRKFTNAAKLLTETGEESGLIDEVKRDIEEGRNSGYIHPSAPNKLYAELLETACQAYREAGMTKKARPFCSETLQLKPHSIQGLLHKAQTAIDEDDFEEAIRVLNTAKEHRSSSNEVESLLQRAHTLLKRSKQKDYYKILGVSRDSDERTIKRAYRQLTKQHHPDKALSQGVSKEEAEKKMAAINEAYEVLSDPELKQRYDNGDDPNDPQSQGRHPFYGQPFSHSNGQPFFFHQGGPQFKFTTGQGFNFPGGFPFR